MNQLAFSRYKKVRVIFWVSLIVGFVLLFFEKTAVSSFLFILAWIAAMISVFMPCPYCGKSIGYRRFGILAAGNAFGGWCLHCGNRLFGKKINNINSKEDLP